MMSEPTSSSPPITGYRLSADKVEELVEHLMEGGLIGRRARIHGGVVQDVERVDVGLVELVLTLGGDPDDQLACSC